MAFAAGVKCTLDMAVSFAVAGAGMCVCVGSAINPIKDSNSSAAK
jgi:hypothetical protein